MVSGEKFWRWPEYDFTKKVDEQWKYRAPLMYCISQTYAFQPGHHRVMEMPSRTDGNAVRYKGDLIDNINYKDYKYAKWDGFSVRHGYIINYMSAEP